MIQVKYLDYDAIFRRQIEAETSFISEEAFSLWVASCLDLQVESGSHGDPTLSFMKIQVKRPGQDWKHFKL